MDFHRIRAVVMRHLYSFQRDWDRLADAIYWPMFDMILWGLTTKWLQDKPEYASHVLLVMLTAIVFWQMVWRAHSEIVISLLSETWTGNVVNMFASPLRLSEWVTGCMVIGIIKIALGLLVGFGASWLLYSTNLLLVGNLLLPFLVSLVLFGWCLGLLTSSMILYWGRKIQSLAWVIGHIFAPVSAVYYPLSALPDWLQYVALLLPTTYVFEGMRYVIRTGAIPTDMLLKSFALDAVYLAIALVVFSWTFEKRRQKGLQKLE